MKKILFAGIITALSLVSTESISKENTFGISLMPQTTFSNAEYQIAKSYFLPDYMEQLETEATNSCSAYGMLDSCPSTQTGEKVSPKFGLYCYKNCKCPAEYKYTDEDCYNLDMFKEAASEKCNGLAKECVDRTACPEGWTWDYLGGQGCSKTNPGGYDFDYLPIRGQSTGGGGKFCIGNCRPAPCPDNTSLEKTGTCSNNATWTKLDYITSGEENCYGCDCDANIYNKTDYICRAEHNNNSNWKADTQNGVCTNYWNAKKYSLCACTPNNSCSGYDRTSGSECECGYETCDNGCETKYRCKECPKCDSPYVEYAASWCGGASLSCYVPNTSNAACVILPTCESLGYTADVSSCNGYPVIRCPFDTSYVFCYK